MAAKKANSILVSINRQGGEYRSSVLLAGAYKGQTHSLGNAVCNEFERQTGITLAEGTSKVFRMTLVPQRKKAAARK